jgi:hypothetical protein
MKLLKNVLTNFEECKIMTHETNVIEKKVKEENSQTGFDLKKLVEKWSRMKIDEKNDILWMKMITKKK